MANPCVIRGATVVTDGQERPLDVRIEDGRITAMAPRLDGGETFDATGLHLLPGLIDDQVHFREPGMTHKADIASESAAAVAGGTTSYLEMPNTIPPTIDAHRLQDKLDRAAAGSAANYGFYLGANGDNAAAVREARHLPACGIKVFLSESTGDLMVREPAAQEEVFAAVPGDMVLAAHCEDQDRLDERTAAMRAAHGDDMPMALHPELRDAEACHRATVRAISLARRHGTRLHVLHLTTARELELFTSGPVDGKRLTCEACVHHLHFADTDYARLGGRIKCNPAIKAAPDRAALRAALATGTVDVVATDHAPHLPAEKAGGYFDVGAGLPLVEHALLVLLGLVHDGVLGLADVARLGAHNPARLFGIVDRGHVQVGHHADLVLVDLQGSTPASDAAARSKCGWTPFAGHTFPARIAAVWVSGRLAYADGEVQPGTGMQLEYDRR